jgi:hypothetical protein
MKYAEMGVTLMVAAVLFMASPAFAELTGGGSAISADGVRDRATRRTALVHDRRSAEAIGSTIRS